MNTRKIYLQLTVFVLFAPAISKAVDEQAYWSNEIPVMDNATNVESKRIESVSTKTTSFHIETESIETVFRYYNDFFTANGWVDPYQVPTSMREQIGGNWSGFNFTFDAEGEPKAVFARVWKGAAIPVIANVTFEANNYDGRNFSGKVMVTIAPEVSAAPLMSIQRELSKRPEALFILSNQIDGNPFDLTNANISARPELKDSDPILVEYFAAIDKILENYKQFRERYISK